MNLANTNNNEQPAPGVAAETNDPQQQPTIDNPPPAAVGEQPIQPILDINAQRNQDPPQVDGSEDPSVNDLQLPPLEGVTPLSGDNNILIQSILASVQLVLVASFTESEKKAEACRRAAIEQAVLQRKRQDEEALRLARVERERETEIQRKRNEEALQAQQAEELRVQQETRRALIDECECEAAARAAAHMEDDAKHSERKVRRRRKKKKSKKCIKHECVEDTTIDVVVIYSSGFPVENFSDPFLVENPMFSATTEQVDSTKSESLSPSEPVFSARVQLTPAVSNNIGVLRCYVEEMLMFPIGLLVQASACMWKSADAVQSCLTATEIPVNRLHAKVFTVFPSSTVWDPGGISRAAAVQRLTWMTRRVSEAEERHQHCLAFTSFTSAAGWIGRGDRGTAHSELCWLLRLLLF